MQTVVVKQKFAGKTISGLIEQAQTKSNRGTRRTKQEQVKIRKNGNKEQ
jgi:hypothetical protein